MSTIAIIPARKGSKGIPGKNMKPFLGKPLVQWTIEQAKAAEGIDQVIVSSDWDEVLTLAGLRLSFWRRSLGTSTDQASTEMVLDEVLERLPSEADTIVLLQPTSPLRRPEDIDQALECFQKGGYDSLFSAVSFDRFLWWQRGPEGDHHMAPLNYTLLDQRPRRQDIEYPQWLENGSIYIFDAEMYLETSPRNRLFGNVGVHEMPAWTQLELDTEDDWELMELVASRKLGVDVTPFLPQVRGGPCLTE